MLTPVRDKYSGGMEERFGPTLAADHLASEDGLEITPGPATLDVNISSYEAANQFLAETYLPERNQRYSRAAASEEDFHRAKLSLRRLEQIRRDRQPQIRGGATIAEYVLRHGVHNGEKIGARKPVEKTLPQLRLLLYT